MNFHPGLIREARKSGLLLAGAVLCGALGGLLAVVQARRLSRLIAAVFFEGQTLPDVQPLLGLLLAIFLLRAATVFLGEWAAGAAAVRVKNSLRGQLFQKIQRLGPVHAGRERSGELIAAAVQGVDALDAYISQYLPQVALAAAVPLIVLASVFPLDLLSGVILLLTAPLIPVFMVLIGSLSEGMTRRQYTALSRMSAFFLDTLQGLTTLKALGQGEKQAGRIQRVSRKYRDATMSVLRVAFLSALVLELVGTLSTAVIAVQIGLRLLYSQMGFEQAFFILVIAPEFYLPLRQLGLRFHAGMSGIQAARRIFEILDAPEPLTSPRSAKIVQAPLQISYEDVHYGYAGREGEVLNGISFELRSGEQLALVGESGSGKSTLAHLLMKWIEPDGGQIWVNGLDLRELGAEAWREQISLVPQSPYLYAASLAENIAISRKNASRAEIRRAAVLAGLEELLDTLPEGLDTCIGENGARLSGGQAQRLALARAFLRDAPLLVLDEPTAHLDAAQEEQIEQAAGRLREGRTVLVIAHRLPTVQRAGRILVLDHGQIIEAGTHAELLRAGGRYARMVSVYRGESG